MIKWIGIHIFDFVAKFRIIVYLEKLPFRKQDHVVGVDKKGRLYKQKVNFNLIDGDGTSLEIKGGDHVKLVEGSGIDINYTDVSDGTSSDPYDITISATNNFSKVLGKWALQARLLASSGTVEQILGLSQASTTALTSNLHFFVVPYDLSVKRIVTRADVDIGATSVVRVHKIVKTNNATRIVTGGGSSTVATHETVDYSANVGQSVVTQLSSAATFVAGDIIAFTVQPSLAANCNYHMSIMYEIDHGELS